MSQDFLELRNAEAVPLASIPDLPSNDFAGQLATAPGRGRRLVSYFAAPVADMEIYDLVCVLADDAAGTLHVGQTRVEGKTFPSVTSTNPQAHLFEREISEQWGLTPLGHPWLKPVRFHAAIAGATGPAPVIGQMDYYAVEGDEIHEVAVGPVHAGVIEPGHFRFQCHGEWVHHLEISLGYQHRGIEQAISAAGIAPWHLVETIAGDSTIAHTSAWSSAMESLADGSPTPRAQVIAAIALELERLANHVGDLGNLANDVAFLPTASFCGRLRGDFLNMTALICGNRFGRGLLRPGGVRFDLEPSRCDELASRLARARTDLESAVNLLWSTPSVMTRFEHTGKVSRADAVSAGLVGPAARACGLSRDVRVDHPGGIWRFVHVPTSVWESGDVFARAWVRWLECQQSMVFISEQLRQLPEGPVRTPIAAPRPERLVVTLVEGWRGEVCHVAMTDDTGRIARYKVCDPSFHNWTGLALSLRGQQISDFPLCNKSFNLSYCGFDL